MEDGTSQLIDDDLNENCKPEDTLKILIATDNHLGYGEKDSIRGQDSYNTFEEILEHAVVNEVDLILLGGDLFHDANPTTNALNKCMNLLRKYTFGDSPIQLEFLSNQNKNFYNGMVNYEDPFINVAIPVFSIHGNHDDPSGFAQLSSLDLLSTTGLVNYFGKCSDLTNINIDPILLQKGETYLALYGLSYIHDSRLSRLFADIKVMMCRPDDNIVDLESWFNIMVVHQNRADRGPKNYLPEEILPDFLDLVLWGHEHDCRIQLEQNAEKLFRVTQPGSSVATSLSEGEAKEKFCGLLYINKKQFKLTPIKLETVRPFVFKSIDLKDYEEEIEQGDGDTGQNVQAFVKGQIEIMLAEAKLKLTGHKRQPTLPLIRLRLIYHNEGQMFNQIRFGQQYHNLVANPKDMILFKKFGKKKNNDPANFDKGVFNRVYAEAQAENEICVEDIVAQYFEEVDNTKKLKLFSIDSLSEACRQLVQHNDDDAVLEIVNFYKDKLCNHLNEVHPEENQIADEIQTFQAQKASDLVKPMQEMLDKRGQKKRSTFNPHNVLGDDDDDNESDDINSSNKSNNIGTIPVVGRGGQTNTRGRGRGRGRGAKAEISAPKKSTRAQLNLTPATTFNVRSQRTTTQTTKQSTSARKPSSKVTYAIDDSDSN